MVKRDSKCKEIKHNVYKEVTCDAFTEQNELYTVLVEFWILVRTIRWM